MKIEDMRPRALELYELLPALLRSRDDDQDGVLRELIDIVAEQTLLLEENLQQLYDDQFIETCADWVVPYIGDLIGYRGVHGVTRSTGIARAEVANTIRYRRRKGTASMLEQLARDVTDWPAHAVEFFRLLATTQHMNHVRLNAPATANVRSWRVTEEVDGPFDTLAHRVDVRSPARRGGRYNIPNVGMFLWRIGAQRLRESPAVRVDGRRYRFSPLGADMQLYARVEPEDRIESLSGPLNVPLPLSRRRLDDAFRAARAHDYYGAGRSFCIRANGAAIPAQDVCICNLEDDGASGWAHVPDDACVAVDPERGRLAFPADQPEPRDVVVDFHYGFAAMLGGGEYPRAQSFAAPAEDQVLRFVPDDFAFLQDAIDSLPAAGGVVEIRDNGRYVQALRIDAAPDARIELRAADGRRPHIVLTEDFVIEGASGSTVTLSGLLISGDESAAATSPGRVVVQAGTDQLGLLELKDCTLVPGLRLGEDGTPLLPESSSLRIETTGSRVAVERCLLGAVQLAEEVAFSCRDSSIDAISPDGVAIAGLQNEAPAGWLRLNATTVIGKVSAQAMPLIQNSIVHARVRSVGDLWSAPVLCVRKQEGCVRFSFIPLGSMTPRSFRCQPELEAATEIERQERASGAPLSAAAKEAVRAHVAGMLTPAFTSNRHGHPGYLQLLHSCAVQIRQGADDESEMGVFHLLQQAKREANLRVRLDEYLRFGLEAGLIYAS